ncbi:hypothetical protein A7K94_0212335, partial [Modestobacter sp. VKM Ac-2676]
MLDLEALPRLPRAERVQAVDTWLAGLLAEALTGTPRPTGRRGAPPATPAEQGVALVAVGQPGPAR